MVRYILVYAVLICIVVLMLWIGRRYSRGRANGMPFPQATLFRKPQSQTQNAAGTLSGLLSLPGKLMQNRIVQTQPNPEEVKQALELLEDLYRDFETDMQRVRTDFSVALEALHHEMDERLSRLEETVQRLTETSAGRAERRAVSTELETARAAAVEVAALATGGAEEQTRTAATRTAAAAEPPVEAKSAQWDALSPSHQEAIRKLREGIAVEEVAQGLRLGVGEIAILKRLAKHPTGEPSEEYV